MLELCHSGNSSGWVMIMFTIETRAEGGAHTEGSGVESMSFRRVRVE